MRTGLRGCFSGRRFEEGGRTWNLAWEQDLGRVIGVWDTIDVDLTVILFIDPLLNAIDIDPTLA